MTEAYSKIKFLELEVVQANTKVERVSSEELDEVLSHQKSFSNITGLGYTRKSSLAVNISKEVNFVKAKEPIVVTTTTKKVKVEKNRNVADQRLLNKPYNQSGLKPKGNHFQNHKRFENKTFLPSLWTSRTHQTKFS